MQREDLFPTSVYHVQLADLAEFNVEMAAHLLEEKANDPNPVERSNVVVTGGWHGASDLNHRPIAQPLVDRIKRAAETVIRDQYYPDGSELHITTMWGMVNPPGSLGRAHVHPGVLWSGVYYVQTPPNCGGLSFDDPRAVQVMTAPVPEKSNGDLRTSTQVTYPPRTGLLIMFPSFLSHGVRVNATTETGAAANRISISFNLQYARQVK